MAHTALGVMYGAFRSRIQRLESSALPPPPIRRLREVVRRFIGGAGSGDGVGDSSNVIQDFREVGDRVVQ